MRQILGLCLFFLIPTLGLTSPREPVDLVLVLATDVSASIVGRDYRLQNEGLAAAFENEEVIFALTNAGPEGRVAVLYYEWAGFSAQSVGIPWTIIDGEESAKNYAARIRSIDRFGAADEVFDGATGVAAAVHFGISQILSANYPTNRKIIDISSDGFENTGTDISSARDRAVEEGIQINAIVISANIRNPESRDHQDMLAAHGHTDLLRYYQENVIVGPRAFVLEALRFQDFGAAIRRKLVMELAAR
jgi:hypothetical protein